SWKGTVTVVFYDGLVYFWFRDPQLNIAKDGSATLKATVGGYGSDRNDGTKWIQFPTRTVVLASGQVRRSGAGVVLQPVYKDVVLTNVTDQKLAGGSTNPGAWPQGFVDFQLATGLAQYWYSTGNSHDYRKPPDPLYISWDAAKSISQPPKTSGAKDNSGNKPTGFPSPSNPAPRPKPSPGGGSSWRGGSGGQSWTSGGGSTGADPDQEASFFDPELPGEWAEGNEGPAGDNWDMAVDAVQFHVPASELVPEALTDQPKSHLAIQIAVLTIICTIGLALAGWRFGWFVAPKKGRNK
ncbi:MAG: hypothetical protein FWG16_03890, partial [Micrococcales bacterium]|nr:hypothetical protein [Micrococcales bacterium]